VSAVALWTLARRQRAVSCPAAPHSIERLTAASEREYYHAVSSMSSKGGHDALEIRHGGSRSQADRPAGRARDRRLHRCGRPLFVPDRTPEAAKHKRLHRAQPERALVRLLPRQFKNGTRGSPAVAAAPVAESVPAAAAFADAVWAVEASLLT